MSRLIYILLLLVNTCFAQNEAYFIDRITAKLGGQQEVKVENGRVDIVTSEYAIEVEWAEKWKHSIGQCLWYALQTNKKPGIILIIKTTEDRKHGIRLQSAIDFAGLTDKVKVWFYPEDFGESYEVGITPYQEMYEKSRVISSGYSMNKNSKARHNTSCTYYNCKNCVPCGANDGKACGKCGG